MEGAVGGTMCELLVRLSIRRKGCWSVCCWFIYSIRSKWRRWALKQQLRWVMAPSKRLSSAAGDTSQHRRQSTREEKKEIMTVLTTNRSPSPHPRRGTPPEPALVAHVHCRFCHCRRRAIRVGIIPIASSPPLYQRMMGVQPPPLLR